MDFLFADDAAITTHTEEELQQLKQRFTVAYEDFGLTISLKKIEVMGQDIDAPPSIGIREYALEAVHEFVYLGSTITDNLSLETEINRHIWTQLPHSSG